MDSSKASPKEWKVVAAVAAASALGIGAVVMASPSSGGSDTPQPITLQNQVSLDRTDTAQRGFVVITDQLRDLRAEREAISAAIEQASQKAAAKATADSSAEPTTQSSEPSASISATPSTQPSPAPAPTVRPTPTPQPAPPPPADSTISVVSPVSLDSLSSSVSFESLSSP